MRKYSTDVEVTLSPVNSSNPPEVTVSLFDQTVTLVVTEEVTILFTAELDDCTKKLVIGFYGKSNSDTGENEKAVIIKEIRLNGILTEKAIELSNYTPVYPEPWLSEQASPPKKVLAGVDYLGWNGTWEIEFSIPVFTWIHQVEHLGWIHPVG